MDAAQINRTISALRTHRDILGNEVVDGAVHALQQLPHPSSVSSATTIETRSLTVFVAHIHGLTPFLQAISTAKSATLPQKLWQPLDQTVSEHHGVVHIHFGNYLMAFFGMDTARQNEPEWAIRTALQLRQSVADVRMEWNDDHAFPEAIPSLAVSVGLHTGIVSLRGEADSGEFEALGETVDFALALAQSAKPNSILISADMYNHVRGVFYVRQLSDRINLDDAGTTIGAYLVKGAKPYAVRVISRSVEGVETEMVGRQPAFHALKSAFSTVTQTGRAQLIVINGEAGIGKSRLLYEFDQWMEQRPVNLRLLQGRASFQTQGVPYSVLRDIFMFYFGIFASDSTASTRRKLSQGIADITASQNTETMAEKIERLIGFSGEAVPLFPTESEQKRLAASVEAVQLFFATLTADNVPAILILEDIHWADAASLRVLKAVWKSSAQIPLLVVCTTRPQLFAEYPTWFVENEQTLKVDLPPLSTTQTSKLIKQIFRKIPAIPPQLQTELIDRAGGNPLLLEEQIQLLIDDDVILPFPTRWRVNTEAMDAVVLPTDLNDVLRARFVRLPALEQEMLQRAATIGRAFWNVALTRMSDSESTGLTVDVVNVVLENLQERGVILEREASPFAQTKEYIFKHASLRNAILNTLPPDAAIAYHAQLANWLIEYNGEQVDTYASLIAAHFYTANQPMQATEWYLRAGMYALAVFAWDVALVHFDQVHQLLATGADAAQTQLQTDLARGMTLALWWQAAQSTTRNPHTVFEKAVTWAVRAGDAVIQSRVLHHWSVAERRWGDPIRAEELLQQAQSIMP